MNNSADQLARLKKKDEYLDKLFIRLSLIESGTAQHFPHWRESIFNFQVSQWIEALQGNNTVEQVTLDLSLPENTLWTERTVRSFLAAIGSIPTLEKLIIRQNVLASPQRIASISAIRGAIENARCLKYLELEGARIAEGDNRPDLQALANTIAHKNHLRTFKFKRFLLDEATVNFLLLPVLQNHHIQEISLGNTLSGPLLDALQQSPLQKLTLSFNHQLDDKICNKIMEIFSHNDQLCSLSLLNTIRSNRTDHGISEKGFESLTKLMQQNHTLVELKTSGCTPNADIEFFCKLNRAGRKKLFNAEQEATRRDWVDVLCAVLAEEEDGTDAGATTVQSDPVEFVFYILSLNPCLCEV